jgi:hypothetical protein
MTDSPHNWRNVWTLQKLEEGGGGSPIDRSREAGVVATISQAQEAGRSCSRPAEDAIVISHFMKISVFYVCRNLWVPARYNGPGWGITADMGLVFAHGCGPSVFFDSLFDVILR